MSEIIIPTGAPDYICADLCRVISQEKYADDRYLEELEKQIAEGRITEADALRDIGEMPALGTEIIDYCRVNCDAGNCAMRGFGIELVGVKDVDTLNPEDQAKFAFFRSVDTTKACAEMAAGVFFF